jgi:hypothetical protein
VSHRSGSHRSVSDCLASFLTFGCETRSGATLCKSDLQMILRSWRTIDPWSLKTRAGTLKTGQIPCRAAGLGTRSESATGSENKLTPPRRRTIWIQYKKSSLLSSITYRFCCVNKKRNKEYKIRHFLSLFVRFLKNFSTKTAFSDAFCHARFGAS